jgi:hypothetical protein
MSGIGCEAPDSRRRYRVEVAETSVCIIVRQKGMEVFYADEKLTGTPARGGSSGVRPPGGRIGRGKSLNHMFFGAWGLAPVHLICGRKVLVIVGNRVEGFRQKL